MTASRRRITYQLVAPMEATLGTAEMDRRRAFLERYAEAGTEIEVRSVARGTASVESAYDAAIIVPYIIEELREAETQGAAACIVGCFSDPGLDAVREVVKVPVVGPGMSAMMLALQVGHRFSILSSNAKGSGHSATYVRQLGLSDRYASTRGVGLSVLELAQGHASALTRMIEVGKRCVEEDGADVLIMGCMSMAFQGLTHEVQDRVGVPVVSPILAALKTAEAMLIHGIAHSRSGWPTPPSKKIIERPKRRG